jgi:anti-sigma-K factor RskA
MSDADHMDGSDDGDRVLVAEYVLGLLNAAEHETVARRIAAEPRLKAEQALWQSRLASLDREFAEVAAPTSVLTKLEGRLFGSTAPSGGLADWWNSLALWRGLATGGVAVAVAAIGFNLMQPRVDVDAVATQLVAALQSQEGSGVEFVAFYDSATKAVRLIGLQGQAIPEKDFELWYIKGDEPAVSMGVIPVDQRTEIPLDPATQAKFGEGTVLAVTLEQKGGSPTGVAQGPIVAVGAAMPI